MSLRIAVIISFIIGLSGCTLAERIQNKLGPTQNEPEAVQEKPPSQPTTSPKRNPQENRLNERVTLQQTQLQQLEEEQIRNREALKRLEEKLITNFELLERSVSDALGNMQMQIQKLSANLKQSSDSVEQQPSSTQTASTQSLTSPSKKRANRPVPTQKNSQKVIEDYSLFSPQKLPDSNKNDTVSLPKILKQKSLIPIPLPPKNQIVDETKPLDSLETQKPSTASLKVSQKSLNQAIMDPNLKEPQAPYKLKSRPQVKKLYDQGMDAMINRKYPDAVQSFQDMLKQFPDDEYSDNALFWLGHIHYTLDQLNEAEEAFHKVLTQYEHRPTSQGYKTPDAIYMLGKISEARNDKDRSAYYFHEVIKRFPGSTAASNAEENLKSLE